MKNYATKKAEFVAKVKEEIHEMSKRSISWGEIAQFQNSIYKDAKKYGLLKEFKQNGIL